MEEFHSRCCTTALELFLQSLENSSTKYEIEVPDEYDVDEIEVTVHYLYAKDDDRYRVCTVKQLIRIFRDNQNQFP